MREGLLAAGTALIVFAVGLVIEWRVQTTPEWDMNRLGRTFSTAGRGIGLLCLVFLIMIVGVTAGVDISWDKTLLLGAISFGVAALLAGSLMYLRGQYLQQNFVGGLLAGIVLAFGVALACIGYALYKFVN